MVLLAEPKFLMISAVGLIASSMIQYKILNRAQPNPTCLLPKVSCSQKAEFFICKTKDLRGVKVISKTEAIARAQQWLHDSNTSFEGREVTTSLNQVYKVVFSPPEDTLGGDFTILVDAETGAIVDAIIER